MSLRVGDSVFVDGVHPANIVAFVGDDCCEVAWASGAKYGTVVPCSNVQSMFAEPTRRRRPTQKYIDATSTEAEKKMEAKTKRVADVKKERKRSSQVAAYGKETTSEPPKKVMRTKEPPSRPKVAAQVNVAFQSSKKRKRGVMAMRKFAENSAAGPRRNVMTRLQGESDTDKKPAAKPRKSATTSKPHAVSENDNKSLAISMDVPVGSDSRWCAIL